MLFAAAGSCAGPGVGGSLAQRKLPVGAGISLTPLFVAYLVGVVMVVGASLYKRWP
jgi:hypothetical protein